MKSKLMILGAGPLQLPAIQIAKHKGLDVVVADMNPNAIGFKESNIVKELISTTDTKRILEASIRHKIDGIITVASDVPMPTVATVCEKLRLNGISIQTALNSTNKAEMRTRFKEKEVPSPKFFVARTYDEFIALSRNFRDKFIAKASDNSGNRGVSLVENICEVELKTAFEYAKSNTKDGRILLEEYMEGPEFSVEGISVEGEYHVIQVTDKITTGAPYFVELGHTQPSLLDEKTLNSIKNVAQKGVEALGICCGPSHAEIKLTSSGPKIVEIGARLGGGCITSHLVPLSTGINMIEASIDLALGNIPDLSPKFSKGAAIRFINGDEGIIDRFEGIALANDNPNVIEIGFFRNEGDYVPPLRTGLDRIGYVIVQEKDNESAARECENVLKQIKVVTK